MPGFSQSSRVPTPTNSLRRVILTRLLICLLRSLRIITLNRNKELVNNSISVCQRYKRLEVVDPLEEDNIVVDRTAEAGLVRNSLSLTWWGV